MPKKKRKLTHCPTTFELFPVFCLAIQRCGVVVVGISVGVVGV
jgi:hypothetical protein